MSQVQQNLHQTLNPDEEEEEEEEALSLSDLPSTPTSPPSTKPTHLLLPIPIPNPTDEFEFRVSFSATETSDYPITEMCAADDLFFNGTILPLQRPSVSSSPTTSRSGSSSSSSGSSSSSSYCISRSHSAKSAPVPVLSIPDPPRRSVSNNFLYAFPSPSPAQLRTTAGGRKSTSVSSGRKSTSSMPGNILRLGVLPAPEMDVIRSRRGSERRVNGVEKRQQLGFGSYGFGCKCVPDEVIEPMGTRTTMAVGKLKLEASRKERNGEDKGGKKVEKKNSALKLKLRMGESLCRTRIFHWIEELSIGKTS